MTSQEFKSIILRRLEAQERCDELSIKNVMQRPAANAIENDAFIMAIDQMTRDGLINASKAMGDHPLESYFNNVEITPAGLAMLQSE